MNDTTWKEKQWQEHLIKTVQKTCRNLQHNTVLTTKYKIIGSAHNIKELNLKIIQGCSYFIFSRLFETNYKNKPGYLGIIKFNLFKLSIKKNLVPLGGINLLNLNKGSILQAATTKEVIV